MRQNAKHYFSKDSTIDSGNNGAQKYRAETMRHNPKRIRAVSHAAPMKLEVIKDLRGIYNIWIWLVLLSGVIMRAGACKMRRSLIVMPKGENKTVKRFRVGYTWAYSPSCSHAPPKWRPFCDFCQGREHEVILKSLKLTSPHYQEGWGMEHERCWARWLLSRRGKASKATRSPLISST